MNAMEIGTGITVTEELMVAALSVTEVAVMVTGPAGTEEGAL